MQDGYTIREATSLELTEVAEVLARAFENDPAYGRITSKISANAFEALREIFIFQLRRHFIPEGLIDVVESPDGRIVAVALWDGPGRHSTLAAQLGMLGDYVRILGKEIPASVLREARTAKYQPRFSHWYLHLVATAPEAQGQGLGQALIEEGLARAGDGAVRRGLYHWGLPWACPRRRRRGVSGSHHTAFGGAVRAAGLRATGGH